VRRQRLGLLAVLIFLGFALPPLLHNRWIALSALAATPALTELLGAARGAAQRPGQARTALALLLAALSLALLSGAAALLVDTPPDPFLLGSLALVAACGACAFALALRPGLPERAGTLAAGACALVLAATGALHGIPDQPGLARRPDFTLSSRDPVPPLSHAFPALRFLEAEGLEGRLFTEYHWAGPAIHRLWPAVHVFIDSRSEVYGDALLRKYYRMLMNPIAARRGLDGYDVELVLVAHRTYPFDMRHNGGILVLLEQDSGWALLYADDHAVLYARTDGGRALPSSLEPLRPRHLRPDTLGAPDPELEALLGRALERAPDSSFLRFALASLLAARGETSLARAQLERAWTANPRQPAAPQLAGELATAAGDAEAARIWFQRAERAGLPSKLRGPR
jgi:tetratricopeptide (TPR) repeat protein